MPPPSAFVFAPADFEPGAKAADTSVNLSGQQTFVRVFDRAHLGGQPLTAVGMVIVYPDAETASADFGTLRTEVGLTSGRAKFAEYWGIGLVKGFARGRSS